MDKFLSRRDHVFGESLLDRMAKEFENFPLPSLFYGSKVGFNPKMNIQENDASFVISVELPGMSKEDIEIEVNVPYLTIKGEKKVEVNAEKNQTHVMERSYGKFQRTINLPDSADFSSIEAESKDGVLTITVNKKEDKQNKKFKINIK